MTLPEFGYRNMTSSLLRWYRQASPETVEAGSHWYDDTLRQCTLFADQYGVTVDHVAVALAHLSPRMRWSQNIDLVDMLLAGKERPAWAMRAFWAKALDSLEADKPLDTFGDRALKTREFARAILGNRQAVVVDTWAARAAGVPETSYRSIPGYHRIADSYRRGARRVNVPPRDLQAIVWCTVRGTEK